MNSEEKRAWVFGVVSAIAYSIYVVVILGRAGSSALVEVPYVSTLLWTVGGAIVASIVLHIAVTIVSPEDAGQKDQRDRDIYRYGEYVGQSFMVIGGVAALVLAMLQANHFWIANALYLGFVLSALLSSATKIIVYRLGFHPW